MVQHKRSYHIDQSVNKTSSKIDSTYPSCPLDAISIIWTFKIPHQFIDKRKKRKPRRELTKGDLNSTARDSGKWLLEMDGHQFVILPTGIDCYGGFCYARCVDCPDIGIQMFWLSSLWADGLMATDVLGFSLKPCLLLSDDPKVRAAARQKTAGEQLAEQGEYLEGGDE
ncbi:MAG: hypothetical protein VKK42_16615 [Lyngbya sp.]|nr:hypothetical protein [Lyngbya sp.]